MTFNLREIRILASARCQSIGLNLPTQFPLRKNTGDFPQVCSKKSGNMLKIFWQVASLESQDHLGLRQ